MNKRKKRGVCKRCGRYGDTEWHHVFGGVFRGISEREGFVMELCRDCHREMHDNPAFGRVYKERFQLEWENRPGNHRSSWLHLMGKSWITTDAKGGR